MSGSADHGSKAQATVRLQLAEVHRLGSEALQGLGCSRGQADAIAETMTAAERDGAAWHGLVRVSFYGRAIRGCEVIPDAQPTLHDLAPGVVRVDGGLGFAPLALKVGVPVLAERARSEGIAALALNNVFHITALWPEIERLTDAGLVAFAFTGANEYVLPAGGTEAVYGTNPMAFGWPRANGSPVIIDQAASVCARGEIRRHLELGLDIPEGWAVGPDGMPTTDPAQALAGAQLPFGGHKGASIALMVELLAGALIGDLFSFEAGRHDIHDVGAPRGGEFMLAIDPGRCVASERAPDSQARGESLFTRILEQDGTRLPGQRRYEFRERARRHGVDIPVALVTELQAMASTGKK